MKALGCPLWGFKPPASPSHRFTSMSSSTYRYLPALFLGLPLLLSPGRAQQFTLLSTGSANIGTGTGGGEVTAFDPATKRLFVTRTQPGVAMGVNYFDYTNPSNPSPIGFIDFSTTFGTVDDAESTTSVAVDPLGRGFGVAALLPNRDPAFNPTNTVLGKIGFFDTQTGAILNTVNVGFHPDMVTFSPDGSRLVIANEGEYVALSTATQQPGSVSTLDLSGVTAANRAATLGGLSNASVTTVDFSSAPGLLAGVRPTTPILGGTGGNETQVQAIEPEYISVQGTRAFVSLQENNAIGVFDLTSSSFTAVHNLGTINQLVDAVSGNGAGTFNHTIKGLPMPDTLAAFEHAGKTYLATANEGDSREDGKDQMSVLNLGQPGFPTYEGAPLDSSLRALRISRIDGDTDADGAIDEIHMYGTRSFSIFDADTGALVYDSGNFFEAYIALNDPAGYVDSRSPQKGPEPEALAVGTVDGKRLLAVGMEQTNSLFLFDISDPTSPVFLDYERLSGAQVPVRPESFNFVSAADSPIGVALLLVGYEGSDPESERLGVFALGAVPEPSSAALLLLAGLGCITRRRRL